MNKIIVFDDRWEFNLINKLIRKKRIKERKKVRQLRKSFKK